MQNLSTGYMYVNDGICDQCLKEKKLVTENKRWELCLIHPVVIQCFLCFPQL